MALVQSTPFEKCNGGEPAPTALRIDGCDENPCKILRQRNRDFEIDFDIRECTELSKKRKFFEIYF